MHIYTYKHMSWAKDVEELSRTSVAKTYRIHAHM